MDADLLWFVFVVGCATLAWFALDRAHARLTRARDAEFTIDERG